MSISIKAKYDNHEGKGKAITSSFTTKVEAVYIDTEYRIFIVYVCGHRNLLTAYITTLYVNIHIIVKQVSLSH